MMLKKRSTDKISLAVQKKPFFGRVVEGSYLVQCFFSQIWGKFSPRILMGKIFPHIVVGEIFPQTVFVV